MKKMNPRNQLYSDILSVFNSPYIEVFKSLDSNHNDDLKDMLRQLMKIDLIRKEVVKMRIDRAVENGEMKSLQTTKNHQVFSSETTIQYNLKGIINDTSSARSNRLIKPLSCLEILRPLEMNNRRAGYLSDIDIEVPAKVLCVGPRTEAEIFLLWAYGFSLEDITGVDLISYSEFIELGDMHELKYNDSTFDVIIASCTLYYSNNISQAVSELKRVAKSNAIFAIAQDIRGPGDRAESKEMFGVEYYDPKSIIELFFPNDEVNVLYEHFAEKNLNKINGCTSSCIFQSR